MFTVYLDDSGTDPNQHVAIASAFVIPAQQIIPLEREWETFKKKEQFSSIHISELLARNYKSEYAGWDEIKQERVFRRVRRISMKYGISLAASFAANKADYDELVPESFRNDIGKHHYTWAIRQVVSFIDQWRASRLRVPLEYVFDWMGGRKDERRIEVETVMEQAEIIAKHRGSEGDYTNYSFRHRNDVPGLQCVDAIGWTCYQKALLLFRKTPLKPFADAAWKDYGAHEEKGWLHAITVTRENLQKWIALEIADGTSIERFRQWRESKTFTVKGPA